VVEAIHPSASIVPPQVLNKRTLRFQEDWCKRFPWLHYCTATKKVFCFYCSKVCCAKEHPWSRNAEEAFVSTGFSNWKKAIEKFKSHSQSHVHFLACNHYSQQSKPVDIQLSRQKLEQQSTARKCLQAMSLPLSTLLGKDLRFKDMKESTKICKSC